MIHHHRMVNHQINRRQWINLFRVPAKLHHGIAHGGQIHHRRNAGEILHQHPRGAIGDFMLFGVARAFGQRGDVIGGDRCAILIADQVFEQHFQRIGQFCHFWMLFLQRGKRIIFIGFASNGHVAAALVFQLIGHGELPHGLNISSSQASSRLLGKVHRLLGVRPKSSLG